MEGTLNVNPGEVWRGRLILDGPGQYVKADFIANTLKASGAAQVWVWKSTDSPSFPEDWPNEKRADVSDLFEVQWFVQLRIGGAVEQQYPTKGTNWRIHDAWLYQEGTAIEPPPPVDPTKPDVPYKDDIGDYAGKPDKPMDKWAKGVLVEAFHTVMGRWPTLVELQTIQAVGKHEGHYGWPGKPPQWAGSHNWGAITCKPNEPQPVIDVWGHEDEDATARSRCKCGFLSGDGAYQNGKWQPYVTCFASRPTNLEGAVHLVEVLYLKRPTVQKAIAEHPGNLLAFARAMRDTNYFCRTKGKDKGGRWTCSAATDKQKQEDAEWYGAILDRRAREIGAATGDGQLASMPHKADVKTPAIDKTPRATPTLGGYIAAGALTIMSTIAGYTLIRGRR